jgi:hypothetical protein
MLQYTILLVSPHCRESWSSGTGLWPCILVSVLVRLFIRYPVGSSEVNLYYADTMPRMTVGQYRQPDSFSRGFPQFKNEFFASCEI